MTRISFVAAGLAAVLAFGAAPADAQTIGFKVGASMSKLSIDGTTEDSDWNTGFMGGGFVRFNLGRIGLQPELLAVTKGAKLDDGADEGSLEIEYVAVPVLLHLPLTYGTSFTPYIVAGPEFAFDIGCEATLNDVTVDCDSSEFPDEAFARKTVDIGLTAGGGFGFAMGPGALLLEGRYTHGLSNIDDTPDPVEIKNRSIYITAGYSIPLGGR